MKKNILFISILSIIIFLSSCYTPSPLYGTWADNDGNKIGFYDDGTFMATISTEDKKLNYDGNYKCIDNVLIFITSNEGRALQINTEWDIRGSILYLTWTANGVTKNLSLYHTAR